MSEEAERYRVTVYAGAEVVRSTVVSGPSWTYAASDQLADFAGAAPAPLVVEVRQGSGVYGWGAPCRRSLLH